MRGYSRASDRNVGDYKPPATVTNGETEKVQRDRLEKELARVLHHIDCLEERIVELEDKLEALGKAPG